MIRAFEKMYFRIDLYKHACKGCISVGFDFQPILVPVCQFHGSIHGVETWDLAGELIVFPRAPISHHWVSLVVSPYLNDNNRSKDLGEPAAHWAMHLACVFLVILHDSKAGVAGPWSTLV